LLKLEHSASGVSGAPLTTPHSALRTPNSLDPPHFGSRAGSEG
jgi:hypothetical protein